MKETGTAHWKGPNTGSADEYGFKALPGGLRNNVDDDIGHFSGIGDIGRFWSGEAPSNAYYRWISYDRADLFEASSLKPYGHSVRCIKD